MPREGHRHREALAEPERTSRHSLAAILPGAEDKDKACLTRQPSEGQEGALSPAEKLRGLLGASRLWAMASPGGAPGDSRAAAPKRRRKGHSHFIARRTVRGASEPRPRGSHAS